MMFIVTLLVARLVPMLLIASVALVAGRFAYDRYRGWNETAARAVFALILLLGAVGLAPAVFRARSLAAAEWNFGNMEWQRSVDAYDRYQRLGGRLGSSLGANHAKALMNIGQWDAAEETLLETVPRESESSSGVAAPSETIYLLGVCRYYSGRLGLARRTLESLPSSSAFFLASYYLGRIQERSGDPARAIELYRAGIELEPEFFASHYHLVRLLVETGQMESAAAAFNAMPESFSAGPQASHLGSLRSALMNPDTQIPEVEFQIVQMAS